MLRRSPHIRHGLRCLLAAFLACVCQALWPAAVPGPSPARADAACTVRPGVPAKRTLRELRSSLRCLANRARARRGTRAVRGHRSLGRAAGGHARSMVRYRYFAHGATGRRIARSGYFSGARSFGYGENIAYGCGRRGAARAIFRGWMRSRAHRATLLRARFEHVGIGVARGAPRDGGRRAATYSLDVGFRDG